LSWRRELKLINLLLLAGVAFLLVAIIYIWWGGGAMPFQGPAAKGPEMPKAPILRDQQPLTAFMTVTDKNLFSQTRNNPSVGDAKVQDSLEGRQLLGTMVIGETRAAIIGGKLAGGGKGKAEIEAVYLGEEWNGFKVLEIANDSVTFLNKDGRKTLKFPE
jgi:hypothetical protein